MKRLNFLKTILALVGAPLIKVKEGFKPYSITVGYGTGHSKDIANLHPDQAGHDALMSYWNGALGDSWSISPKVNDWTTTFDRWRSMRQIDSHIKKNMETFAILDGKWSICDANGDNRVEFENQDSIEQIVLNSLEQGLTKIADGVVEKGWPRPSFEDVFFGFSFTVNLPYPIYVKVKIEERECECDYWRGKGTAMFCQRCTGKRKLATIEPSLNP